MDWIFKNIDVILALAGAVAIWLNQRRREKNGEPADYDEDGKPDNETPAGRVFDPARMEAEEAERTRQLQEELRRKREERAGQATPTLRPEQSPPPVPAPTRREATPPPVYQDPMGELMKDLARKLVKPVAQPSYMAPTSEEEEALRRQRELDEKYRQLAARQAELRKQTASLREQACGQQSVALQQVNDTDWLASLRNPSQVRRAIVMNELLGKPVALRS